MSEPAPGSDDEFSMKPTSSPQIDVEGPTVVRSTQSSHSLTLAHPPGLPPVRWSMPAYGTPTSPSVVGHPHLTGFPAGGLPWQQQHVAGAQMAFGGRYHPQPSALGLGAATAAAAAAATAAAAAGSQPGPVSSPASYPPTAYEAGTAPPASTTMTTPSPSHVMGTGGASGEADEVGAGQQQQQSRGAADAAGPPCPRTPPPPIRDCPPVYEDWPLNGLKGDFRRRAEANKNAGYRYGSGDDDVNTSISNTKRADIVKQLKSRDEWIKSQGYEPEWTMSPLCTPIHKRVAREAKEKEKADVDQAKARQHALRAPDAARLVAIVFSEFYYEEVCNSEQPPKDRNIDDKKEHGAKGPLWSRIGVSFATRGWESNGVKLANPVSHEGETQVGVPQMWERLQAIDYEAPADKWRNIWSRLNGDKKGQLDEEAAGVRVHGWWKDLRKDFRLLRKREDQSGEHADHAWSFCGNKLVNMLMLDWFDVRGGVAANPACQQYFEIELSEESGAAFNSLTEDRSESDASDSDGESGDGSRTRKRKPQDAKGTSRMSDSSMKDALEVHMGKFAAIGDSMVSAINKSAGSLAASAVATMGAAAGRTGLELLGDLEKAREHSMRADDALEAAETDATCSTKKLKKLQEVAEVAEEVYQALWAAWKQSKNSRNED